VFFVSFVVGKIMKTKLLNSFLVTISLSLLSGCQQPVKEHNIAFSRLTEDHWQIWTMPIDGNGARQVTESAIDKRYPLWIAGSSDIVFRDNNNRFYRVNVDEGDETQIFDFFGLIDSYALAPDGEHVMFVRLRREIKDSGDLWVSTLEGKEERIITRDKGLQHEPDWSTDNERIAYVSSHGYRTAELYVVDVDGKNKVRLTNNNARETLPVFSPDGSTLCYASDESGNYEIWTMHVGSKERKQLTDSLSMDTRPYWSPDGEQIVFVSNRSGSLQLWIMNADGSEPRQLTEGPPSMDPAWRTTKE
ncbi:MAG: hypothetical protein MI922_00465, partial [Bacteroidales bacterium]|nr:hypothetical protein [Bacteroidales bacterium]